MAKSDYKELSFEQIVEEIRKLMAVAREKEGQQAETSKVKPERDVSLDDPDYYYDDDDSSYTDDEKTGEFESWDKKVVEDMARILTGDKLEGANTQEEMLRSEITREQALRETKKQIHAAQCDKAKVMAKRFSLFSLNARAAVSATTRTIGDKVKGYANDYASKEIAIKKYNAAMYALDKEWKNYHDVMRDEINNLQKAENSQIGVISGLVNAKNIKIQKQQDKEKELKNTIVKAWQNRDSSVFRQAAGELDKFNEDIDRFDKRIKKETETLRSIRENIKLHEDELHRILDEKQAQYNDVVARVEGKRNMELEKIPKHNFFTNAIGKLFNRIFTSKTKKQGIKDQEEVSIIEQYVSQVKKQVLQFNEEREAREEQYDRDFWADDEEIEEEPTWMDRFEESRQSITQKSEQNKQEKAQNKAIEEQKREEARKLKIEKRAERRRLKVEKQNRKMDERIEKARQKLEKLQSKQISYNRTPVAEGR